ncbi:unnamed protein product [Clavelina lepadiformis]|uniref:Fibronectin type-III domain-containing protein n=1 Tax=Clavelina lepadiformis TaxID=159417 RepID=A0ABP0FXM8_CLALP
MLKGKLFLFLGLLASTRAEIPEPEDLSAIEIRSTKVVIKWKMATNDTQYKMSVETTDSPSPNKPPDDDDDLESEVEVEELTNGNNLQPNTDYKLYLFAINKTNSADFNMSSITFTTAPAAPYMVTIKQAYVHELDVTWQHKATDRTMKYEVSYRGGSNGKEPRIKETEGKEKYLKLIGLDSNSKYIVSVSALTEGERIFSDDSAATSRSTGIRKPDSPMVSGASASSMNVTWHMTTGGGAAAITGYKVYWDPPHNKGNKNVNGASENATQISGLTPSTSYELYVVVVTAESDGPFSNTTTAVTLPDAPLDVKVSRPTVDDDTTVKRGIIVQWKPPRGGNLIEDYVVDWMPFSAGNHSSSHGNYSSSQLIPHNSKNASFQYSIQYLTPGTKYKIQVKAGNVAGMGERSSPQYYRIDPAVPTNVLATKTTSNTTVVLWSIPTGVYDGYKIYRVKGKNHFEQMRQGRPENVSMHSYQLRGLEENTPYVFAVTAISGTDDEETPAESEKSRPTATYTLPGVPTNITLSLGNDRTTEVIIDFDEPRNGAKSYYVILNATDEVPVEINTDKLPIFQNLLNPGQTYDVTILAIGDGGEGEISPVHSITMEPPSPTNPNVEEFNADSIEITWDLPLDTDSIWDTQVIRYFDAEDKSSAKNISLDRNITSYKFTGLTSGMSYTIQLFTVSNQLFSEDTTLSQTTELRPPTKLQLVRHTTDTLVVRWLTPSGDVVFDKFLLEYSLLDEMRMDVDTKSINIPENTTEAVLSGLRAGSVYEVSIKTLGEEESDPVTRQFPTIPNPVNNLKVTQKSSNPSRALLVEWNQPKGAGDSIIVDYHGFPSNTKDSRELQFESTKLSLTVLPGNNYTISVKVSSIGSWSTLQTFNISSKPATVNFDAKPHMRMLALSWKKLQGFAEQIIVQPFAENISQRVVLNTNETAYNITDLDPNSSYKIQMYSQMYNVEGSLENSEITTKTFKTSAVPIAKLDAPVVTGVSSSSITLKWTAAPVSEDSETVNGYRLMWQPPFNNGAKDVEGHDIVSTTISGLQANTLYNVSLFALTPTGSGPTSDLVAATTGIGTPQNVVAANATFRSFVLNWTRVVNGALTINGYSINWTSSLTNDSTHINGGNVTRTRITGLYPNTRYSVKIAANTINGYREFSKPVSVETKLQGPGNLIITGSTTTALNITWRGCEGKVISLTGYRLVWTPATNGGEKKVDGVAINTTVVEGLNPNTNYNISVQVLTADGPGPQSSQSTATTKCGAPEKLLVRRPLAAEGDSTSSVFVNWIKPEGGDDILDYVVDRRVFSGSDIVSSIPLSHEKGKTSYNVTLKFLTPGQKYAFTVKARNLAGVSLPSKEEIYRTNPGRPQNLRVTSKTSTSVILAWDKPQFALWSYNAFFALASKNLAAIPENQLVNLSSTSYQVTGLKPNTEYDFALTSVSGDDTTTAESAKTEVKSSYTLPGTPTNIKVVLGHRRAHDVVVSFSPPQYGATGYSALLLTVGESPARNSSNTSPVHVNQLTPGQTYNVIVEAYGEAGTGATSEKSSITLAPAPGNGLMVEKFAANYIFTKWNLPVSLNSVYDRQMVTYKVSENSAGPVKTYLNKSTTSYNITGLTSGMNYTIEVFCLSKDLFSVPITLHHDTEILGPTNLQAVNQTANSIQIKWTAAAGVVVFKKYMVEYSSLDESGLPTEPKSIDVAKDKTTANITGLEGGNIYFMSVKSVGTRTSEPVSENFFTRPSPVRNLTVTRSPENPTKKIYVTWETPSGSGENISMSYVSFPTDTKKTKYVQFNENETFFDALPGYFYFVTVKVNNFKMSSDEMSAEISSSTLALPFFY